MVCQNSTLTGRGPKDRRKASDTIIFKKGKKEDLGSYRLVSLTSILRKMMEQLILKIISGHVKDKKVLRNSQHEFTKKKICLINLLLFNDDWLGI